MTPEVIDASEPAGQSGEHPGNADRTGDQNPTSGG